MPPLTALVHDVNVFVAVFESPPVPAGAGVIKLRVKLQPWEVPEAAALWHRAGLTRQEAVGPAK